MQRRRSDAQALGLRRHRRVVDRLHIDAKMVEQQVGDPLALTGASFSKTWPLAPLATRARSGYTYDDREASVYGFIWSKRIVGIASVHKAGVIAVA
jgi:hypothetical protein